MGGSKRYDGYKAFGFLDPGHDYKEFKLTVGPGRVPTYSVPLSKAEEERFHGLMEQSTLIDLHEHPVLFPDDMAEAVEQCNLGRQFMAYEALSTSGIDCVFDHMMDGFTYITSFNGWKWTDVIHDVGIRLSDVAHQSMVVHCRSVADIKEAQRKGRIAWTICLESATPIENEIDRLDVLYGLGVRSIGVCYSESNMLGGGMGESRQDCGLTDFGYDCVKRMNKLGFLVDIGHTSDRTALETIDASDDPIYDSHSGPAAIAVGHIKGDEVLKALAERGGVMGVGGAGNGLSTAKNPVGSIESYMECVEYCIRVMGIDHVACGPDTLYGDHQGLYKYWFSHRIARAQRPGRPERRSFPAPPGTENPRYVKGLENPNEFRNIARWMIRHGYSDKEIQKIVGGNALKLLEKVW